MKKGTVGEQRFTAKELAVQYGVDPETIRAHGVKLFGPGEARKTRQYTEIEATAILARIQRGQNNQFGTARGSSGSSTALSDALRKAELMEIVKRAYEEIIDIQQKEIEALHASKAALSAENTDLKHDNDHANGVSKYLIGLHHEHGDNVIAQYGGLPYWFDH